uniref:Uncharacterized protein n=1 Tax=viral metagenome TaxID=1070528 RepID=A0A6C0LF50_9ZZZZ
MTRYTKSPEGHYIVAGKKHEMLEGSRAQVWHGTAVKTSGGLTKAQLHMNKHGRIVSKKKFNTARKDNRLVKAGYGTKKGQFGFVKLGTGTMKRGKSKKMRGGYSSPYGPLDGAPVPGSGQMGSGAYTYPYAMNGHPPSASYTGGRRRHSRRRH